jgi:hypothetical protein
MHIRPLELNITLTTQLRPTIPPLPSLLPLQAQSCPLTSASASASASTSLSPAHLDLFLSRDISVLKTYTRLPFRQSKHLLLDHLVRHLALRSNVSFQFLATLGTPNGRPALSIKVKC